MTTHSRFARMTAAAGTTAVLAAGLAVVGVSPAAASSTARTTVRYTSDCTYYAPQGTASVDFAAIGGKGGAAGVTVGGNGGMVSGTVDTTSITSITITVGGPGGDASGSAAGAGGTSTGFGSGAAGGAGNSFVGQGGAGGGAATLLRNAATSGSLLLGAGGGGAGYGNDGGIGGGGMGSDSGQGGAGNGTALGDNGGGGGGAVLNTYGTAGSKAPNASTGNGTNGMGNGGVGGANTGTAGTAGGGGGGGGNQGGGGGGASATSGSSGGGGGGSSLYFGSITNVVYGSSALAGQATASVDSAPAAPTGVSAAAVGSDGASISWTAPATSTYCNGALNSPTSYKIEQSTDGGGAWSTVDSSTTTNPYSLSSLGRGSYQFRVSANNSIGNGPAAPATETVVIAGHSQTIAFPVIADTVVDAGPVAVTATASSGLAVTYSSATASTCSVSGASVTLLAPGTCTIDANQAGDATYDPASQVSRSFAITDAPPTPAGKVTQTPTGSCTGLVPPIQVKARGLTSVLPVGGCATNAGQTVRVRTSARQSRLSTRGDVRWFTIIKKKNGRVLIRTYGQRIKLTIALWAPATTDYSAYSATKAYKLR